MTLREAYAIECSTEERRISYIAILDKDSGKAERDYADEYLETHGDIEVSRIVYVPKLDCVYVETLD